MIGMILLASPVWAQKESSAEELWVETSENSTLSNEGSRIFEEENYLWDNDFVAELKIDAERMAADLNNDALVANPNISRQRDRPGKVAPKQICNHCEE